ncbi:MAG: iron-sulfur cluster assembly scaffold protein [Steroidobacteraceae bacterium]
MNRSLGDYSARALDLFRRLPGSAALPACRGRIVYGESAALDRGAWVRFEACIDGGTIVDCAFRAWGCPHTLAASAWAAAAIRGLAIEAAGAIDARQLAEELDVPVEKMGRLLVVEDALRALQAAARALQSA